MFWNERPPIHSQSLNWLFPAFIALVLVSLGAWQHLGYSFEVNQLAFFKNAYDEDTYALLTEIVDDTRLDRLLSTLLIQGFRDWTGGYDLAFILADTLLPAMAFLSCWYLTGRLFLGAEVRAGWALLILLSPDLFSLGNAAAPTADLISLSSFKALFGEMGQVLVPPTDTSYLNIFRTFEPQLAYVAGFLFIGFVLKVFFESAETLRPTDLVLLGVVQGFVLMTYSLVGYPLIAIAAYVAVILLVTGARTAAIVLLAYFLFSAVCVTVSAISVLNGVNLVVASRLPSIGTSTVGALGLSLVITAALANRRFSDRRLWLALGFSGLPVVLMNQQILTGLMVSTRDWERYVNHPLLVVGAAIFYSTLKIGEVADTPRFRRFSNAVWIVLIVGMIAFAIQGTSRTRDAWASINNKSLAMARAIDSVPRDPGREWQLVLDDVGLAPLIAVRSGDRKQFLVDYTNVFINPIPSSTEPAYEVPEMGLGVFEYWRLAAQPPGAVEALLRAEAQSRSGFYSGFFFHLCDYWYPCSDNRAVKSDLIHSLVTKVVAAYAAYLSEYDSAVARDYLLVTTDPARGSFDQHFESAVVATARAGNVVAYVFKAAGMNEPEMSPQSSE